MNKLFIGIILSYLSAALSAGELKYPVSTIPLALKENVQTVIRLNKIELEIKSENSAVVNITEVRTILNKNGEQDRFFIETSNPMNRISNIKGKVYDEFGKQIRSLGYTDVLDYSYINDYSLYEDTRVKYLDPKNMSYPFTVEYSYEIDLKQTLFLPTWSHNLQNTSYENSTFTVKTPIGYNLSYKEYNLSKGVSKTIQDGKNIYSWSLSKLALQKKEPLSTISNPTYPLVRLTPTNFSVGESKGSSESWKDLGKWATTLNEGKDKLPESTIEKVKEITSSCKTDFEKVKKVYEYMQQKTRYVNISIGIGGWQPFEASVVDKLSYGDCKALSNYTKALLTAVGIKSFYTLVKAGRESNSIDASFPSSQFNHAMVCVPMAHDTIWLECTSQRLPCGFNSDFSDDRQVLLIDGDNSRLVHTRIYPASENCITRHSKVNLVDEFSGSAEVSAVYKGLCYDEKLPVYYADDADKKKLVTQSIELPSFTLDKFLYTEHRSQTPSIDEKLNITVSNYIHKLVNDIALLPLNFMNKLTSIPDKVRNRKTDMCIRRPYMENDTAIYQLPTEYTVTEIPEKSEIKSKFGSYSANTTLHGSAITYIRHFELFKGIFPPEAYTEFRDFLEQVSTNDNAVASLKKQIVVVGSK